MLHLLLLLLAGLLVLPATAQAYMGDCPRYTLMQDFNWTALATGTWYVMEKTSTTSRCLTYTFLTDEDGFKTVRQASRLKLADTVGYHQDFVYTGQLASPEQFSAPARMTVQFPLNLVGRASFVVLDTDYTSRALVCSCQEVNLLSVVSLHRRSCSILQRSPDPDPDTRAAMRSVLAAEPGLTSGDDVAHLNRIDHTDCQYSESS